MLLLFKGSDDLHPEQQDPLPSYLDYKSNSSVKSYQTSYFPSLCAESPDSSSHSFELSLGTGMETLGGSCEGRQSDPQGGSREVKLFCDGPLKPNTAYRYNRQRCISVSGIVQPHICIVHLDLGLLQ